MKKNKNKTSYEFINPRTVDNSNVVIFKITIDKINNWFGKYAHYIKTERLWTAPLALVVALVIALYQILYPNGSLVKINDVSFLLIILCLATSLGACSIWLVLSIIETRQSLTVQQALDNFKILSNGMENLVFLSKKDIKKLNEMELYDLQMRYNKELVILKLIREKKFPENKEDIEARIKYLDRMSIIINDKIKK